MINPYDPYLDWIDSQKQTLLQRVKEWVAINTFTLNPDGIERFSSVLQAAFSPLSPLCVSINLPLLKSLGPDGKLHSRVLGPALSFRKRPEAPIQVLLAGHMDTVYPPSSTPHEINELAPGIWKGAGVADMKGGLAILLTTLEALERSPYAQKIGWEVLLTPDEEIGSPCSAKLYESAATRHQCALIFEPGFPDGAFVSERKGSATFSVAVHGKAAHVGRDFAHGRSAVLAIARLIQKLDALQREEDLIFNIADLQGSGPVNIVPPLASCKVNFRSSNAARLLEVGELLKQFALESQEDGITIEVMKDSFRAPKPFDEGTGKLFEAYAQCASQLQMPFQTRATGGVCDGNILAGAGLPTLDTAGAVGGALHTQEEYLICSSLVERAKLATLFLMMLGNGEII